MENSLEAPAGAPESARLSYKFQRLRERLRKAIETGELAGKLPGERELARRFNANPKTLSKALTDLSAEGLLERSIGRGTYVRGSDPARRAVQSRWLILADAGQSESALVQELMKVHQACEVACGTAKMRPSFLNQFQAVVDLSERTPETFHRSLLVRGVPVLALGKEPGSLKVHAVLLDRAYAASCLARDLFLAGHRRLLVVEDSEDHVVLEAARTAANRYLPHAAIEACGMEDREAIGERANTAILCDGESAAMRVRELGGEHPHLQRTALAAVGITAGQAPCSGIFVTAAELASAAAELLKDAQIHRPTVLWMTGSYVERGTIRVLPESRFDSPAAEVA